MPPPSQAGAISPHHLSTHPLLSTSSVPFSYSPCRTKLLAGLPTLSSPFSAQSITLLLKFLPWLPTALGTSPNFLTQPGDAHHLGSRGMTSQGSSLQEARLKRQLWDEGMKSQGDFKALPSLSSQCLDLTLISRERRVAILGTAIPGEWI